MDLEIFYGEEFVHLPFHLLKQQLKLGPEACGNRLCCVKMFLWVTKSLSADDDVDDGKIYDVDDETQRCLKLVVGAPHFHLLVLYHTHDDYLQ